MKAALLFCPRWSRLSPPVASAVLKSSLIADGVEAKCWDFNNILFHLAGEKDKKYWNWDELNPASTIWPDSSSVEKFLGLYRQELNPYFEQIIAYSPSVIGFTVYGDNLNASYWFLKALKSVLPDALFVFGGPECFTQQRAMARMKNFPELDCAACGEGETVLPAIIKNWENRAWKKLPAGLAYRDENNKIVFSEEVTPLPKFDPEVYPDFSDFYDLPYEDQNRYELWVSKGCPNACVYCSEGALGGRFRPRTAVSLLNELTAAMDVWSQPIKRVLLLGSTLNGDLNALKEFCLSLSKKNIDIELFGQGMFRPGMDYETMTILRKGGLKHITFGLESASANVLRLMNKRMSQNIDLDQAVITTFNAGITVGVNIMVGYPGETEEDFNETLEFVERHHSRLRYVNANLEGVLIPPESPLYVNAEKNGITIDKDNPAYWKSDGNDLLSRMQRVQKLQELCKKYDLKGISIKDFSRPNESLLWYALDCIRKAYLTRAKEVLNQVMLHQKYKKWTAAAQAGYQIIDLLEGEKVTSFIKRYPRGRVQAAYFSLRKILGSVLAGEHFKVIQTKHYDLYLYNTASALKDIGQETAIKLFYFISRAKKMPLSYRAGAHYHLSEIFFRKEMHAESEKECLQCLAINKNFQAAKQLLDKVLKHRNKS
jgi:anaerobic magnesium-protoporphyrin IX monomethyl ester cyclase